MYIAEISSKELRGTLSNAMNITQCLGLVITYALSIFVTWRLLAWLLIVPMIFAILGKPYHL